MQEHECSIDYMGNELTSTNIIKQIEALQNQT